MKSFTAHFQDWKVAGIAVLGALLSTTGLQAWHRQQAAWVPAPAATGALSPLRPEFRQTVSLTPPSAAEIARERLEVAGLAFDGPTFVRAVAAGQRTVVEQFRQAGMDLNAPGAGGRTALQAAAWAGEWPLFDELLQAGADAAQADEAGITALMAAASAGRIPAVQALLKHGAPAAALDGQDHSAGHYALWSRSPEVLSLLLEEAPASDAPSVSDDLLAEALASADWHCIDPVLAHAPEGLGWTSEGRALLERALVEHDLPHARALLSRHVGAPTPEGKVQPLLAYALVNGDLERFNLLLEAGADPNTRLGAPVDREFLQKVTGSNLRSYVVSEGGMTVMMLAAGLSRTDFVKPLLEKGARRGLVTDKWKMAALSFAAFADSAPTLQMLIDASPTPEQMRIEVSLGAQKATVIRNGLSVFTTAISSGRPGFATPKGDFVVTDKHAQHKSTIYKADMPFFMRLNCRDFGMHEGVIPGHPASHGCIRLPGSSARQLFRDVPVGTLVSIRD